MGFALSRRQYFLVDGGSGNEHAALLSQLPGIRRAANPRQAEVLVVFAPVTDSLAPSVSELYSAMPRPRAAIVVNAGKESNSGANDVLPYAARTAAGIRAPELANFIGGCSLKHDEDPPERWRPEPIPLPPKSGRDLATELLALSIGPIQPFTAGPLRVLLLCDGEQVFSTQVESGFARRNLGQSLQRAEWPDVVDLAAGLDPLAPIASCVAFIRALENLNKRREPETDTERREAAIAWERVKNVLGWLHLFAFAVAYDQLQAHASALLNEMIHETKNGEQLAQNIGQLAVKIERDHLLRLRTSNIGCLDAKLLRKSQIDGPVLTGSTSGSGDVHARLIARLRSAAADLTRAKPIDIETLRPQKSLWPPPPGSATGTALGPRGTIAATVASNGWSLERVEWLRPSARLLPVIPEMLAGQRLADAELILASLDLSMAEADA